MRCECGQLIEGASIIPPYTIVRYDEKGDIVFAVCSHGMVVINKLTGEEENDG